MTATPYCATNKLACVALPVPLYQQFDYKIANHMPAPAIGCRVLVPFGSRTLVGFVVALIDKKQSNINENKLKFIKALLDENYPVLTPATLTLAYWLSGYYHYPLGETLSAMLPVALKENKPLSFKATVWQANPAADITSFKPTTAQQKVLDILKNNQQISEFDLKTHRLSPKTLATLTQKAILQKHHQSPSLPPTPTLNQSPLTLTDEQSLAVNAIWQAYHDKSYRAFLLYGITGSGKTEVYLQAMTVALNQGKQVLILIPEIGLSPQMLKRFTQRFVAKILVLHSQLSNKERFDGYKACQNGTAQIIIATRSAILYPFYDLGMIIIDEAHDNSYKQHDHLRYHACHVAMYLASCQKIPIVLGSATPTTEMLYWCQNQKMHKLTLNVRAGGNLPAMYLIDKRTAHYAIYANQTNPQQKSTLTYQSINAIFDTLNDGKQALIFVNRRGFAPVLLCSACHFIADCPRCDSHLTVHKTTLNPNHKNNYLKCHHCNYQRDIISHCPDCGSSNLEMIGIGTSSLFEELHALFANPQATHTPYPILQIDRDTTTKKHDWQNLYDTINTGKPMILVGTQMLAKGHHFENVSLVVVIDADIGFLSPNITASETTAALITQVAGRAGRGGHGKVLIETKYPDNPLLKLLIKDGYLAVAEQILAERQLLNFPPFRYAALISSQANSQKAATDAIIWLKNNLPPHQFTILAPLDAPLNKKNNQYFCQMLILSKTRNALKAFLDHWWQHAIKAVPPSVKLSIDIDPLGW